MTQTTDTQAAHAIGLEKTWVSVLNRDAAGGATVPGAA
jgi:hypothetical protein